MQMRMNSSSMREEYLQGWMWVCLNRASQLAEGSQHWGHLLHGVVDLLSTFGAWVQCC